MPRFIATALAAAFVLACAAGPAAATIGPVFVASPATATPGKTARLAFVAPPRAKVCAIQFRRRGARTGARTVTLAGPYVVVRWRTGTAARGTWTARVECGIGRRRAASLGAAETPLVTGRKGRSGRLVRRGSLSIRSRAIPSHLGTVPRPSVRFGAGDDVEDVGKGAVRNPYACGGCTSWAWRNRQDLPSNLGNAGTWAANAAKTGFPVDGTPEVGAIIAWPGSARYSKWGHVAFVEAVEGDAVYVSEASYNEDLPDCGDNVIRRRWVSASADGARFIHRKSYRPGGGNAPPSVAGASWQSAFQANDGRLWIVGGDNRGALDLGVAPNTSPSIASVSGGGWQTAFHGSDNSLWIVGKDNKGAMNLGMRPGTSPSITGLATGGWEAAFQSAGGSLWVIGADNKGDLGLGMAPATSPSITGTVGGGWQAAFQANDNSLWIVGSDNRGSMHVGMRPATSPSITALDGGGWQTAFQSPSGSLWVIGKDSKGDLGLGMAAGTSPSITGLAGGGWQAAFQASDNTLWVVGRDNKGAMNLGMKPGTSPSITGLAGGGWQVAFQAPDGGLWVVGADDRGALNLGMAPATSPSITSYSPG